MSTIKATSEACLEKKFTQVFECSNAQKKEAFNISKFLVYGFFLWLALEIVNPLKAHAIWCRLNPGQYRIFNSSNQTVYTIDVPSTNASPTNRLGIEGQGGEGIVKVTFFESGNSDSVTFDDGYIDLATYMVYSCFSPPAAGNDPPPQRRQ